MREEIVSLLIQEFHDLPIPEVQPRQIDVPLDTQKIISITGPRRAGKTAYCFHLMQKLMEGGHKKSQILYINFEDERLDRSTEVLDIIIKIYLQLYPDTRLDECVFFFDEIQNIPNWDRFVRRVYDTMCKNLVITGSNANALSKDIATSLRGRTLTYEILPLSFSEYLQFQGVSRAPTTTAKLAKIQSYLERYLVNGGFPEAIDYNDAVRLKTLQEYFEVMMYRDVGDRAGVSDSRLLRLLLKRSFGCATKSYSINKVFNELKSAGYRVGKNKVYELAELCQQAYLFFTIPKFTRKIANRELGEKKLFAIDAGLLVALGLVGTQEIGKLMEQAVFIEAYRRSNGHLFFDSNGYECDFLLGEWDQIESAIQVTHSLQDPEVKKREIKGLLSACQKFGLSEGVIVTLHEKDRFQVDGIQINVVPLGEWLLNEPNG